MATTARMIPALHRAAGTGAIRNVRLLHSHVAIVSTSQSQVIRTTSRAFAYPFQRTFTTSFHHLQKQQQGNNNNAKADDPSMPPQTSLEAAAAKSTLDPNAVPDPAESIKSLEELIRELNKDPSTIQSRLEEEAAEEERRRQQEQEQQQQQQQNQKKKWDWSSWRRSKAWRYLWVIFYWSALGSLPIHLLMIRNETKTVREKLEWKIAVLQDMRDKLMRGESIEEEEALLAVGMDRGKRELQHQVDDQMFEDLIKSAEKLDFELSKSFKLPSGSEGDAAVHASPTAVPAIQASPPAPAPVSQPTTPRKPAPPKSEKSFL